MAKDKRYTVAIRIGVKTKLDMQEIANAVKFALENIDGLAFPTYEVFEIEELDYPEIEVEG